MALFEDLGESFFPNALIGVGAVLLAPVLVPAVASGLRPVVKSLVKGGIFVTDKVNAVVAEAGEQLDDLIAEVRAEMAHPAAAEAAAGETAEKRPRKK
jgi:hypothetical protein